MEPKIKVDQSHCNFQLAKYLDAQAWSIHFRDPGRVSRGLGRDQALLLDVFEKNGLPIPDLVASRKGKLLVVEVDHGVKAAMPSLAVYREKEHFLRVEIAKVLRLPKFREVVLGYCKIGAIRNTELLAKMRLADVAFSFDSPLKPREIQLR